MIIIEVAFLAQGLEHRICNATVVGSNPTEGFFHFHGEIYSFSFQPVVNYKS